MRKPCFILWILGLAAIVVTFLHGRAQERRFGGTFIGAVIAADGIVVGSDSRSTFIDENGRSIGYVDGMQKVYVSNTTAVAVSGLTSIEGELFSSFVDRNSFLLSRSADEVLSGFTAWLPFKNSTGVLLLSAGFNQSRPMICARSVVRPQACQDTGSITNRPSASLQSWVSGLHAPPKASSAASALRQAIQESASNDLTVGGEISIVELQPGKGPLWLENPPTDSGWKTICDLVKDYRAGKTTIVPVSSPPELERYLRSACSGR
jgi:hypothetical protein